MKRIVKFLTLAKRKCSHSHQNKLISYFVGKVVLSQDVPLAEMSVLERFVYDDLQLSVLEVWLWDLIEPHVKNYTQQTHCDLFVLFVPEKIKSYVMCICMISPLFEDLPCSFLVYTAFDDDVRLSFGDWLHFPPNSMLELYDQALVLSPSI